jgi:hypothetical protein
MGKLGAKIWRKGEVDGKRYGLEGAKGVRYRGADRQRCDDDERPFLLRMLSQAACRSAVEAASYKITIYIA